MADYNINAVTRRAVFSGSAGTGPYAFTFEILSQTDLAVYFNAQVLTLTTDYTVTINANGTGSITIVTGTNVPTTPDADDQIVIVGGRDIERTTDFVTAGDLRAASLNEQLDSQIIMIQQISEESSRGMRAPVYDPALVADGGVVDMTLPAKASRAGKTLAFDSNGNPVVGEDIGNWRGDWAASTAYTVRDLVKDASNYNVYRCNTAHTSSGSTPISSNTDSAKWDLVFDASYAATQATNAAASATAAAASATAAAASETNAATSETNAGTSETNAATSATNAATSASSASTSASSASTSATNAATSATNAATSETNAATSETNAASSASTASTAATNAATSETNAASSASTASTAATNAATSETNAATSETNAATSETNAASSASSASTSATSAASSATAAAASAASAASAYDSFDDRYLGVKASDPTLDNDGNALVSGALYFSSSENIMKVYDGASWIAATSAGNVSLILYEYTATSGQTTFSGADDNAATLSYTVNNIQVVMNGVILDPSDYTATNGTSVVLASGAALNDIVNIYAFKSFTVADTVSASAGGTFSANVAINGDLTVDTSTLYVDSTNNYVGIATASPSHPLTVNGQIKSTGTNGETVQLQTSSQYTGVSFVGSDGVRDAIIDYDHTSGVMGLKAHTSGHYITFTTGGYTERMRLDVDGNLTIGKTTTDIATAGHALYSTGVATFTRDGSTALRLNRLTSDGELLDFKKDGTSAGSIGINTDRFYIVDNTHGGIVFANGYPAIFASSSSGALSDGTHDIGSGSTRFQDIHATNGTIQTSDANEKQQIASLTDAEITAAKAISKLFKTFKWNSAVEKKGDGARTHTGHIAQEVVQAMTDAGLDAGDYAFFISSTWWEHSVDVPAVAEQTDDEGNVIVEAQDAYTRIDTYESADEAPEGATERTRLGLRYPELLAFIGAATEQRLSNIESRLSALETAQ